MNILQLAFLVPTGILVFVVLVKTWLKHSVTFCKSKKRLDGKVAIVTGATSGIGYETAKNLAKRGAKVIIPCRNLEVGSRIANEIKLETRNKNVKVKKLDLSLLSSIREFCSEILQEESHVDILVNNAGVALTEKEVTDEGFETHYVTNYLGPFLLTNLLLGLMTKSEEVSSRIVNVSSLAHKWAYEIDFENLNSEKCYESGRIYAKTKLYNIWFTYHLHKLITDSNLNICTHAVHPGVVQTEIFRHAKKTLLWKTILSLGNAFFQTSWEGAQTSIHVAVSEEVEGYSGLYWSNCERVQTSDQAQNSKLAKQLWEISMKQANLKSDEYFFTSK